MRILILGGGARENVICEKLNTNNNVFVLNVSDNNKIIQFCINNFIDLVIPSTEDFLCQGIVNEFNQLLPSVKVFGPDKYQSQIEGSKHFSKSLKKTACPPSLDALLEPTTIYTNVEKLWELFPKNILGIAHITGGGFYDNIIRILPEHLDFKLDYWEFPSIFQWIQKESNMTRDEMLSTFNCGYGMIIICNKELNLDYDLESGLNLGLEFELHNGGLKLDPIGKIVSKY